MSINLLVAAVMQCIKSCMDMVQYCPEHYALVHSTAFGGVIDATPASCLAPRPGMMRPLPDTATAIRVPFVIRAIHYHMSSTRCCPRSHPMGWHLMMSKKRLTTWLWGMEMRASEIGDEGVQRIFKPYIPYARLCCTSLNHNPSESGRR